MPLRFQAHSQARLRASPVPAPRPDSPSLLPLLERCLAASPRLLPSPLPSASRSAARPLHAGSAAVRSTARRVRRGLLGAQSLSRLAGRSLHSGGVGGRRESASALPPHGAPERNRVDGAAVGAVRDRAPSKPAVSDGERQLVLLGGVDLRAVAEGRDSPRGGAARSRQQAAARGLAGALGGSNGVGNAVRNPRGRGMEALDDRNRFVLEGGRSGAEGSGGRV